MTSNVTGEATASSWSTARSVTVAVPAAWVVMTRDRVRPLPLRSAVATSSLSEVATTAWASPVSSVICTSTVTVPPGATSWWATGSMTGVSLTPSSEAKPSSRA